MSHTIADLLAELDRAEASGEAFVDFNNPHEILELTRVVLDGLERDIVRLTEKIERDMWAGRTQDVIVGNELIETSLQMRERLRQQITDILGAMS